MHRVLSDPYSDVLCSEECQTKKLLVCCKMFAFFQSHFYVFKCSLALISIARLKPVTDNSIAYRKKHASSTATLSCFALVLLA